jgi:multidrug transporter EmrE-like cation transporter
MSPKLMIWISVALSAFAQVFLKRGMTGLRLRTRSGRGLPSLLLGVASQGFIWLWAGCFAVATVLWLVGLQKLDLSYAYPLVSIGYVLVCVLSAVFFHERVDRNRWLAILVIGSGVILIAGS